MDFSSSGDDEGGRGGELEDALEDVGFKLLRKNSNSSIDELMILLEEAENLLEKVCQKPPKHTADALYILMRALMKDKFLKHTDLDVQVAVASCFNELSRISAPTEPYNDKEMKEFFKLVNIVLKQLSCHSGCNFSRALKILETMAKVRSCLMMIDIDISLVVEMFVILFEVISSDHAFEVFDYMEMIMTMVIDESDEIPFELLSTLLDSVRKENKDTSPISWELGKNVFENCETQLQPCVKEALKTKKLNLDDYDEIIASLCNDTSQGKKRVENGPTVLENEDDGAPQNIDGNGNIVQSETDPRSKRCIKPTYKISPDEIYEHPWMNKGEKNNVINQHNDIEEIISKKDKSKDSINKMVESSVSKLAKDKDPKKEKEKKPRRPCGAKLVSLRIQVWWPEDKTFYTGTVTDYDAESKKHTIFYDDNEIEVLNLRKETWELIDDNKSPVTKPVEEQDIDGPSTAKEPVKIQEKPAKRKAGSSKKQDATSSSKRLKNENRNVTKFGKNSAPDFVYVDDEPNDKRRETNVSTKDDGDNQVVIKDEPGN